MKIAYITNIPLELKDGGGSGVNNATLTQLKKYFEVTSVNVINPHQDLRNKFISKIRRVIGLQGSYHFFSETRLQEIANEFHDIDLGQADAIFFHGFTPWIKTRPTIPYFCFNDASFATYVDIYNKKSRFITKDLDRIYDQEALWLKNASKVFFRSNWALEQTKKHYNFSGGNFNCAGLGGFIPIPAKDEYKTGFNFLFISREFIPKGGAIAVQAVEILQADFPEIKLWVVGEKPSSRYLTNPNIIYKGYFNKKSQIDISNLSQIIASSFALLHPTLKDTNSLVITEAAYFGCPSISSNRFAIPEFIKEGETGYLLEDPQNPKELAEKMRNLIVNPEKYQDMRRNVRKMAIENNTWDLVGERISSEILNSLS